MVENVADDGVEPKPAKIEASGVASNDVKPNVDVKFKVKIPFQAHIVHNQEKPKPVSLKRNLNLNRYIPVFMVLK